MRILLLGVDKEPVPYPRQRKRRRERGQADDYVQRHLEDERNKQDDQNDQQDGANANVHAVPPFGCTYTIANAPEGRFSITRLLLSVELVTTSGALLGRFATA